MNNKHAVPFRPIHEITNKIVKKLANMKKEKGSLPEWEDDPDLEFAFPNGPDGLPEHFLTSDDPEQTGPTFSHKSFLNGQSGSTSTKGVN